MKHFYITVTVQYDGYEWTERAITKAMSEEQARELAEKTDFTHDNGIEVQEIEEVREISLADYRVLRDYIMEI